MTFLRFLDSARLSVHSPGDTRSLLLYVVAAPSSLWMLNVPSLKRYPPASVSNEASPHTHPILYHRTTFISFIALYNTKYHYFVHVFVYLITLLFLYSKVSTTGTEAMSDCPFL